ncbi:Sigma-adaptin 3A [Hypoxylon texense]
MNRLHRFRTKRTYRSLHKSRRKAVPGSETSAHYTTEHDNLDEGGLDVVNASHTDLNGRESVEDDGRLSTWSGPTQSDDQEHPESLRLMPTDSTGSPRIEPTTPALDIDSNEPANISSPGAEPPAGQHRGWLPFHLRRIVFITFAILLGLMVVALEVLFVISQRNQGLTESRSNLHYLWTYGPTAVLTLAQAYWSRVDYEAKVTAPWLRANPICASRDALLLDYVDMFPLLVPFRALKRRDYPVAASATISLLFTILVVLSTGLFTLSPVEIADSSVPISLKTQFVDDPDRLKDPSSLSLYSLASVFANYTYPEGVSDHFAYQSYTSSLPGVLETRATVDGMYLTLACEPSALEDIYLASMLWQIDQDILLSEGGTFYGLVPLENSSISFEYRGCHWTTFFEPSNFFTNLPGHFDEDPDENATQSFPGKFGPVYLLALSPIDGFSPGRCGSTSLEDRRLVFVAAEFNVEFSNITEPNSSAIMELKPTVLRSASLACALDYGITSVDVVRNATGVKNVSRHDDTPPRKFPDITSWDILDAYLDDFIGLVNEDLGYDFTLPRGDSESIFWDTWHNLDISTPSLVDAAYLEPLLIYLYQNFASFLLQQSLTDPVNIASTATATRLVYRLLVQPMTCQLIAATMVLIVMLLIALSSIPQKALPRLMEPGSILATAALAGQLTASRFPHNLGATDTKVLEARLARWGDGDAHVDGLSTADSNSRLSGNIAVGSQEPDTLARSTETLKPISPFVLSPAFRITLFILIASCVATLEVMLQRSVRHQGLWDVQDETYLHYAWTVLPAAIVSLLSLSLTSISSQTRLLAPYHSLIHVAPIDSSLDMDLLRPLMPRALLQQIQTRSLDALATSVAALVSSAFTIGVAALFQLEILPVSSPIQLRTTSTLAMTCDVRRGDFICPPSDDNDPGKTLSILMGASLILESNLSYTSLSYENLVFPGFALEQPVTENTAINAVIPAARHRLTCHWYTNSDVNATLFYNQSVSYNYGQQLVLSDGLAFNISGEDCAVQRNPALQSTAAFMIDDPQEGFFASAIDLRGNDEFGCSSFLYIWGRYSALTNTPEISASALGCNATTETVDVDVSLMGPQLQLDPSRPPQPIESTLQSYDLYYLSGFYTYNSLHSLPLLRNDTTFDPFFEQLVTSRYAIPISSIGDPSQAQAVKDAIIFQHGIIAAQYLSASDRWENIPPPDPSNASALPIFPSISGLTPTTDTGVYSAVASDPYGRRRLVQDPASTRVVEALLLAALVLSLLGWVLGPRKAVLPRSPTSVASVLALLAGGDVLDYMYKDDGGDWQTVEDAKAVFPKGCKFWMGWGWAGASKGEKEQRFGIWMVPNPANYSSRSSPSATRPRGCSPSARPLVKLDSGTDAVVVVAPGEPRGGRGSWMALRRRARPADARGAHPARARSHGGQRPAGRMGHAAWPFGVGTRTR